jgi:AraC family transcriptional regulator
MSAEPHYVEPRNLLSDFPFFFKRFGRWGGVRVQHVRVGRGEMSEHHHSEHEISVPVDGSYLVTGFTGTGKRVMGVRKPGHTSIVPAGQRFSVSWSGDLEDISVFVRPTELSRLAAQSMMNDRVELIEGCGKQDHLLRHLALMLAAELVSPHPAGQIYAESLADSLVAHLLRHYTANGMRLKPVNGGLAAHKLRRAKEYIEDNLSRDLSLAEIAGSVDLSTYHFVRAFKQTTGVTPHQYLLSSRIEQAKQLLADTDLPLVEIGYRIGFGSQSHFTTTFRRLVKRTPGAFRADARF